MKRVAFCTFGCRLNQYDTETMRTLLTDEGDWRAVPFDEEADAMIRAAVEAAQERGSVALEASGAISDDGIIDPRDTRTVLGICLSVVRNKPVEGTDGYGVFRL